MSHLTPLDLDVLASGPDPRHHDLPAAELPEGWTLTAVRDHLEGCGPCARSLDDAHHFLESLRPAAGAEAAPVLEARLAEALAPRTSPWGQRWALAAAAAVVALGAVWFWPDAPPAPGAGADEALQTEYAELMEAVREDDTDPLQERALALDHWTQETESLGQDEPEDECLFACSGLGGLLDLDTQGMNTLLADLDTVRGG